MSIKKARLWNVLFLIFFLIPCILYFTIGQSMVETTDEGRKKSEMPQISINNWHDFPKEFEDYYNDTVLFRSKIIRANSLLSYKFFNESESNQVMIGKSDWLFYRNTIIDYKHNNLYTQEQLQSIKNTLEEANTYFQGKGIQFAIYIAPNKNSIYAENMPSNYLINGEVSKANQLYQYLQENTNINVIYPQKELIEYKNEHIDHPIYLHLDTHWNFLGACIGSDVLLKKLGQKGLDIKNMRLEEINSPVYIWNDYDLTRMLNLSDDLNQDINYQITNYSDKIITTQQDIFKNEKEYNSIVRYDSNAKNQKIYMSGDSFGAPMLQYIAADYAQVIYSHDFDKDLLEDEKPDAYVFEVVERNLSDFNQLNVH